MKTDNILRVGIVGAGWIAEKAAITLNAMPCAECHAIASRSKAKADAFAAQWHVEKSYGYYSELIDDDDVDLVYVATPHSHHYDVTMEALSKGKACLVEKAFMANVWQSEDTVRLAREKGVLLAEAIWTRYQPVVPMVRGLIDQGRIGTPRLITASIGYSMGNKPRIMQPDLCGGALLDLGVYALNFVRMFACSDITDVSSQCVKGTTGTDLMNAATLTLANGMMASIQSAACCVNSNQGCICGTEGYIVIDNINNPQTVDIYARDRVFAEHIDVPKQITGYEYQFAACREAIQRGWTESPLMPLDETLYIMRLMDNLREEWGVTFPMDRKKEDNE